MSKCTQRPSAKLTEINSAVQPGAYIFCDRLSGAVRFRVEADARGSLPAEHAASLLAIHCLMSGQKPEDFTVLVAPDKDLFDPIGARARSLIETGHMISKGPRVSAREREVLQCVSQNMSNKEISSRLCVSVRTVKFHISSLLTKFKVSNRGALIRQATIRPWSANEVPADSLFGFTPPPGIEDAMKASSEARHAVSPRRHEPGSVVAMDARSKAIAARTRQDVVAR